MRQDPRPVQAITIRLAVVTLTCKSCRASVSGGQEPGAKFTLIVASIAQSAMVRVLSRKLSAYKQVVALLRQDLERKEYRGVAARMENVVQRGWAAVCDAKY